MINTDRYQSRTCLCIYSTRDDLEKSIEENHQNVLHSVWKREYFYPDGKFSPVQVIMSVISYGMGMIGYAAETAIMKAILALGNSLAFLISLFSGDRDRIRERRILCLDSWAALGIGLVGCVCPPLAYRLDEAAKEAMLTLASKVV